MSHVRSRTRSVPSPRPSISAPAREPNLGDYLVLARRYWIVLTAVVALSVTVGSGIFYTSAPRYKARTDVVVIATSDITSPGKVSSDVSIDSAVQILLSDRVLGVTARSLDYPGRSTGLMTDMTISPLINSRILRLYVTSPTPQQAYDAVTLLVKNFMDVRQEALLTDQKSEATALQAQLKSIESALQQPYAAVVLPDQYSTTTNRDLASERSRLQSALISLDVNVPDPGYISHAATLPSDPVRSGGFIVAGSSVAVGLLLGFAVAAGLDRRRRHRPATDR